MACSSVIIQSISSSSDNQDPRLQLPENIAKVQRYIQDNFAKVEARATTPGDVLYVLNQCPFLQIVNADYSTYGEVNFKVHRAKSGWDIHDYGDALSVSLGELLYGGKRSEKEDDDEGGDSGIGGLDGKGTGTIVKQAVDTTIEMVQMAIDRGWGGLLLIDGHPLMQWAAWMDSYDKGFILQGYEATQQDFEKRERILRIEEFLDSYRQARTLGRSPR